MFEKSFYLAFCSAGMYGFFRLIHFIVYGTSRDFADGFTAGFLSLIAIIWLGQRLGCFEIVDRD